MSASWTNVRQILDDALELPPAERRAFLESACLGDGALRRDVEGLLQFEDVAETALQPLFERAARDLLMEAGSDDLVGARIGPYRLTSLIARGGMGEVYAAARADDAYEQRVALKVFGGSIGAEDGVARFHRERQILARLQHPGITRLLDGGTTRGGRPYLVMEHVEGRPLDRAVQGMHLDGRLVLFAQVCSAVEYAHRNLVVHRDLKPGNILVTRAGTVKLLDFGVSKLLCADRPCDPSGGSATATGATPMTIRYASPEQITGEPITTATDVYALGVVLFELLTGTMPYDTGSSLQAATEAICRATPPRPSEIGRSLGRELDAIVLHAIAKSPEDRYTTVEALGDDVRRYRQGQTVLAHPPANLYRLRKALRRHRWPAALAGVATLLILASAVLATALSVRLAEERNAAVTARERAELVNDFLARTLIAADPIDGGRGQLSVRELLADASRRLADDPPADPGTRAALHLTIGRAHLKLRSVRDAAPHLEQAVALLRRAAPDPPVLAAALGHLARLHVLRFDHAAAESAWREAIGLHETTTDRQAMAEAHLGLARSLRMQQRIGEGRRHARAALELQRSLHGEAHAAIAGVIEELARSALADGDVDDALRLHDDAMRMREGLYGPVHDVVAEGLEAGAEMNRSAGRTAVALDLHRRALTMRESLHGPHHPTTINPRLHAGILSSRLGDRAAGERLMAHALETAEASLPDWHRGVRYARSVYGLFLAESGRYAEALPLLEAARTTCLRLWGPENALSIHLAAHIGVVRDVVDGVREAGQPGGGPLVDRYMAPDGTCRACGFSFELRVMLYARAEVGSFCQDAQVAALFAIDDVSFCALPDPADLDGNGTVDVNDLVLLISNWGACQDGPGCLARRLHEPERPAGDPFA